MEIKQMTTTDSEASWIKLPRHGVEFSSDFQNTLLSKAYHSFTDRRHIFAKLIWIFFFTVTLACTIGHYYLVTSEYLKRGVTTKVMVGYSNLPFPSVSVCNINPIRQSAVGTNIQPLRSFLDAIEPRPQSRTSGFYPHECQPNTRRMDQGPQRPPWENIARRPGSGSGSWSWSWTISWAHVQVLREDHHLFVRDHHHFGLPDCPSFKVVTKQWLIGIVINPIVWDTLTAG